MICRILSGSSSLAVAAQNLCDLVSNNILNILTTNLKIFSGIEYFRLIPHNLSDTCCKCKTKIGVDVDLTYCGTSCLTEHVFRNTDCICKVTAVCLNDLYILLRNGGCTVKYDRELRDTLGNLIQNVKTKLRLLTRFELECAMACSDCDCQRVNACTLYELLNLIRMCILSISVSNLNIILNTGKLTKLCLYYNALVMSVLNNLLCDCDILLKREMRSIDHDRCESAIDTGLADLEICAVIQMKRDRNIIELQSCLNQLHKILMLCILSGTCGYLKYDRGF